MKVEYIDHMGSDLTVVNAARVSFDKESDWVYTGIAQEGLSEKDERLIRYLTTHKHESPFAHCYVTFRVKAPIFVARQLVKHQVGFSWNEVSRRYVDSEPEFFEPDEWRKRAEDKKQGSSDEPVDFSVVGQEISSEYKKVALAYYTLLLDEGVCPEQARMVLPQSMYTEWYWTGSLLGWARVCNLRLKPDAQKETSMIAQKIDNHMKELFPISWKYLRETEGE